MVRAVVVGGSISGLFTAKFLLERGVDVVVVERKKGFGEGIVCAGGVSSFMIRKAGVKVGDEFVACKVSGARIYGPSMEYSDLELKSEYGLVLRRDAWEKALGEEIASMGAEVILGMDARSVVGGISYDYLVGCDGIAGASRRLLGLKPPSTDDVHVAVQALCRCRGLPDDKVSLFFGSAVAERGYGWAFPVGGSEYRVGVGVPLSLSKRLLQSFSELASRIGAELLDKPRCKLVPTAGPCDSLVYGRALLVGDAGLQTDPATGGGIAPAIIGARCAAEAISKGDPRMYDSLWRKQLYRRNKVRYTLKQVLYEMSDGELDDLVAELRSFKPMSESIGLALIQLIAHLAVKRPQMLVRHAVARRLVRAIY